MSQFKAINAYKKLLRKLWLNMNWYAIAIRENGEKEVIDLQTFKTKGRRLVLFYKAFFNNTLSRWNKDEANLFGKAEKMSSVCL
jgi:hypothetical protein